MHKINIYKWTLKLRILRKIVSKIFILILFNVNALFSDYSSIKNANSIDIKSTRRKFLNILINSFFR